MNKHALKKIALTSLSSLPVLLFSHRILLAEVVTSRWDREDGEKHTFKAESNVVLSTSNTLTSTRSS